ncbi:MAG: RNA methyltransferase [Planctomycetota bacterium]
MNPDPLATPEVLREREARDRSGLFYLDGLGLVRRAIRSRRMPVATVVCPELLRHSSTRDFAEHRRSGGFPVCQVAEREFRHLSRRAAPDGIGAILRQDAGSLPRPATAGEIWIGFDMIRSPGNLGTCLRTAAAAGARGAVFLGEGCDPYDPGALRAAMGATFRLRLARAEERVFAAWRRRTRALVVGASSRARRDYRAVRPGRGPIVVMMGDERKGLTRRQRRLCDLLVRIPMARGSDSLNVGVAAGLMLYAVRAD